jgi:acetylornithine deacetylase/succinyl-diaminopimelate desuccinylase-like protein
MSLRAALARYNQERERHLEELENLVRIPSVSAAGFDAAEVRRSAEEMKGAHPYVYGDWLHADGAPTVLLYAHHDVQPPGREELWETPPFEPVLRDGRLFGRGSADDKAGVVVHTASVDSWLSSAGRLPVNVKIIIEGEEEIGSWHLEEFLRTYHDKMRADVMVLTDAANWDTGVPSLTRRLRGLVSVDVELRALRRPLHSGMWGGPVPDPAMGLARLLATLVDDAGRIAVPGVNDGVRALSPSERIELERLPTGVDRFRQHAGLRPGVELLGAWTTPWEAVWHQPALTVNAFQASSRAQVANIICEAAWARVTIRTVPDQDAAWVHECLVRHLRQNIPWGLELVLHSEPHASWWCTDTQGPVFEKARQALKAGYGTDAIMMGCGGTIPFATPFSSALGDVPALLMGIEDPYTNAHSENESLHVGDFHKAVISQIHLFEQLGAR